MWWWIFFGLFILISVVSSTLLFFSLKRITQYENLIIQFQQIITYTSERMKVVDSKGHYEADDEVGFFFKEIKQLQNALDTIFEEETQDAKKEN